MSTTSFLSGLFFHLHTTVHTHSQIYAYYLSWLFISQLFVSFWLFRLPYRHIHQISWLCYFEIVFALNITQLSFRPTFIFYLDYYYCSLLSGFLLLVLSFKPPTTWVIIWVFSSFCHLFCVIRTKSIPFRKISEVSPSWLLLQTYYWTVCTAMKSTILFLPLLLNILFAWCALLSWLSKFVF